MSDDDQGSVTRWIGDLMAGDPEAARRLWERYFAALVQMARARLRAAPRAAVDEEDVALSVFDSLCAAVSQGRFPRLDDRDDLWKLLVTLTARKAVNQVKYERRQKRGGGRVVNASVLDHPGPEGGELDRIAGTGPTPEFAALVAEEFRQRLEGLRDDTLRAIALLKLEGYTDAEIAEQLGCARRTITRKLVVIRHAWTAPPSP